MRTYTTSEAEAHLKDESVDMQSTDPSAVDPIIRVAEDIYSHFDKDLVITSAADGEHMRGSKHYEGEALDLRGSKAWGYSDRVLRQIVSHLRRELGEEYDVVRERTHLHIERDPA